MRRTYEIRRHRNEKRVLRVLVVISLTILVLLLVCLHNMGRPLF